MSVKSAKWLEVARELAVTELAELGAEAEREGAISDKWWERLHATGLLKLTLPEDYGGEGLSLAEYFPILAACAPVHGSIRMVIHGANGTWRAVDMFGTSEQKKKYLAEIGKGAYNGFCISEPRTGSGEDVGTTAHETADGWVLNGSKQWATLASRCQLLYIPARAFSVDGQDLGITTFMIEPNREGVTRLPMAETMGCRGLDHDVMIFENCLVPPDRILGEIGRGLDVALLGFLDPSRLSIANSCVGLAEGALDQAMAFATRRETFGKPIVRRQYIQGRLVDMAVEIASTRALVMETAAKFDRGETIAKEAAMCKYLGLEMVGRATEHAMRILGGVGYTKAYAVEQMFRDARGMWFEEGTAEIQKAVISRHLINEWKPALPAKFYGPDPGPESTELALA
jgi:alkylation response protein AidB-like acyl-CoA dehydrogenase